MNRPPSDHAGFNRNVRCIQKSSPTPTLSKYFNEFKLPSDFLCSKKVHTKETLEDSLIVNILDNLLKLNLVESTQEHI